MSKLRYACGLGTAQIERWQQLFERMPEPSRFRQAADARVFTVLDEPPAARGSIEVEPSGQPLELRLGDWSISVRRGDR